MTYEGQARVAGAIAIGLLFITAGSMVAIFVVPIPPANQTLVGQAVGTLLTLLGMVVAFFYSTSSGNRKDAETIATQAKAITVAQQQAPVKATTDETVTLEPGESATVKATDP